MSGNKILNLALGLLLVLAAVFVYFYWRSEPADPGGLYSASELAGEDGEFSAANREFLTILDTLNAIRLDAAILNNPHFQNLKDFSVTLTPEPLGRDNPFAPFGVGNRLNAGTSPNSDDDDTTEDSFDLLNSLNNNGSASGLSPSEQARTLDNL